MDRDDGRARAPERQGVLEVRERRAQLSQHAWHRPRHPQLLEAGGHVHGLDAVGNELGPPRKGREAEPVARRRGQVAQEVEDVRLVTRAPAAENVRVDDDEAHAASVQVHVSRRPRGRGPRERASALEAEPAQLVASLHCFGDATQQSPRGRTDRRAQRRRRPSPRLRPRRSSRPACRRPSPRLSAGRSLRRATRRRRTSRRGKDARARRRIPGPAIPQPRRHPIRARRRLAALRRPAAPPPGRGEVLARLERARRAARSRPRPPGRRAGRLRPTPFGMTVTLSGGVPSSSTSSRFVNSETAIMRLAARTTRGTHKRL